MITQKLEFLELLWKSLKASAKQFEEAQYDNTLCYYNSRAYGNKDFGKTALKRRITIIRQELLALERLVDEYVA